ncbi:MAG: pilus assembly PilX N-terminal domain-containing protein [Candidatus Pacebacteria bacterium]|nr:pilus assembly PilX N-terminal domain-containing protein [Candidatus Paceibacterota bacterium]MBP9842665.1 pilus assembly PilX N-terminal domain-containing protein [Candidatus Paceibacterota bacterium]
MEVKVQNTLKKETGFALLMTLIVVSVVISIGLTVLDLSMKQVRLSTNARESEVAFHAANAGMECARYWRRIASTTMERGGAITPACFSGTLTTNVVTPVPAANLSGNGEAFRYSYALTWDLGNHCTQVTALVASSTAQGAGLTISNMPTLVSGYPNGNTKTCAAGERCTVLSVRGFNRPCTSVTGYGVVQREVLLQF